MIRGSLTYPLNSILVVMSMERLRSGKQGKRMRTAKIANVDVSHYYFRPPDR